MRHGFRRVLTGQFKFLSAKMVPKIISRPAVTARFTPADLRNQFQKQPSDHENSSKIHTSAKKSRGRASPPAVAESVPEERFSETVESFSAAGGGGSGGSGGQLQQNMDDVAKRGQAVTHRVTLGIDAAQEDKHLNGKQKGKGSAASTGISSSGTKSGTISAGGHKISQQDYERLLRTSNEFAEQFRVGRESTLGKLLVDDPKFKDDFDLWLCILRVQTRSNKFHGVRQVWNGLRMRNIDLPLTGEVANTIWKILIWAGNDDEVFLEEVWRYAKELSIRNKGGKWAGMYETFVGGLLAKCPHRAYHWHKKLVYDHWNMESAAFFQRKSPQKVYRNLPSLHQIHKWVKSGKLYRVIIPFLCDNGQFSAAREWHTILVSIGDLPSTTTCLNPLVEHTCLHKPLRGVRKLLDSFLGTPVKFNPSTLIYLISNRKQIKDIIHLLVRYRSQLEEPSLNDFFWLRLLSHWNVSSSQVLDLMQIYDKRTGPVWDRLRQMSLFAAAGMDWHQLGIPTNGNERVTYFKSDTNTRRLPHSTKQTEISTPNYLQTTTVPEGMEAVEAPDTLIFRKNQFVRTLISVAKYREALQEILKMKWKNIIIESETLRFLIRSILVRRQVSRSPDSWHRKGGGIRDIQQVMWLLSWLIKYGIEVQPGLWRETLKRLGMLRRLKELRLLTVWLIRRYHPSRGDVARRYHLEFPPAGEPGGRRRIVWQKKLVRHCEVPTKSPLNPLKKLFPTSFLRSVVEWGFLVHRPGQNIMANHLTWGVKLVRLMKAEDVHVGAGTVSSAVNVRLRALYGSNTPTKARVAWARRKTKPHITEVMCACEDAWGGKLKINVTEAHLK